MPAPKLVLNTRPKKDIAKDAKALQERFTHLRDILANSHEWRNGLDAKRVNHILNNDQVIRNILLRNLNRQNVPLAALPPKEALLIIITLQKQINTISKVMNKQLRQLNPENKAEFDPTDPTHPFNQANPNNLTNQFFAVLSGVTLDENIVAAEELTAENNKADRLDITPELGAEEAVTSLEVATLLQRIPKPSPESERLYQDLKERDPKNADSTLDNVLIKAFEKGGALAFAGSLTKLLEGKGSELGMEVEKAASSIMKPLKTELVRS